MATMSAVTVPSFTGLRASSSCSAKAKVSTAATPSTKLAGPIKASFKDVGVVVAVGAILLGNAMAIEMLLGGNEGSADFEVSTCTGEKITSMEKNGGLRFSQKVVLEEDKVGAEEKLKAGVSEKGIIYSSSLYDCAPLQAGSDMDAKEIRREVVARIMKPW